MGRARAVRAGSANPSMATTRFRRFSSRNRATRKGRILSSRASVTALKGHPPLPGRVTKMCGHADPYDVCSGSCASDHAEPVRSYFCAKRRRVTPTSPLVDIVREVTAAGWVGSRRGKWQALEHSDRAIEHIRCAGRPNLSQLSTEARDFG